MVKRTIVDINGSGGAYLAIAASWTIRRMTVTESLLKADGVTPNVPQGLNYRVRSDGTDAGFTTVFQSDPADNPAFLLGTETDSAYNGMGEVIGTGAQPLVGGSQDATHMADVRSATATTTSIVVLEEV